MLVSLLLLGLSLPVVAESIADGDRQQELQPYSCIVHVHSDMSSSGRHSLPELTDLAREYDVDVIFLTDGLTHTIQYGLPPLRNILWVNHSESSITTIGAERYLARIAEENKRQSGVLYVPGAEVCPRFYWTGSWRGGDLVCHNHQRNIIALGINNAEVLRGIPESCGVLWERNRLWVIWTRILVLAFVVAVLLLVRMPRKLSRRSSYSRNEIRKSIFIGLVMPVLVLIVATEIFGRLCPQFDIYGASGAPKAEQRAIDYLQSHNIVHYWAHPEASDNQKFDGMPIPDISWLPVKKIGIGFSIKTEPYQELLRTTDRYSGFGGVYEDNITVLDPGNAWDEVLNRYVAGHRDAPVWCFGEMLYHYEGQAGKKMGNVETVIWAEDKTQESLCASLRLGRFYARHNWRGRKIELAGWSVETGTDAVSVSLTIESAGRSEDVEISLVRGGVLIDRKSGSTPFDYRFSDSLPSRPMQYYRVVVRGAGALKIVSNPLFVSEHERN